MREVARSFARLSRDDQDWTLQAFGTYIETMMEATTSGAAYVALATALRFVFRIGWAIIPPASGPGV
jgi:hypothetical protein